MTLQNGSFGIDKLTLWVEDYGVEHLDAGHGWTVQSSLSPANPEPMPLHRDKSGVVYGNKAHFNTDRVRLDIDQRGLRIDLNPSKLKHPWHLSGMDVLGTVEDVIQGEAHLAGIKFDPLDLRLSRLDLARQADMTEPLSVYSHAFHLMNGKRMATSTYPTGAMFKNGQRQAIFYGKRAELIHRHKEGFGCGEHTLRAEARFMKHKPVATATGLTYFHDLLQTDDVHLLDVYRGFMARDVFRITGDGQQAIIPLEDLDATFDLIRMTSSERKLLETFERSAGIGLLLVQFGGINGYLDYLSTKGLERTRIWKHGQRLQKLMAYNGMLNEHGKTTPDLVNELRTAFLDAE